MAGGVGVCGGSPETRRDKGRSETRRARPPRLIVPSCAGRNIWFPPAGPQPGLRSASLRGRVGRRLWEGPACPHPTRNAEGSELRLRQVLGLPYTPEIRRLEVLAAVPWVNSLLPRYSPLYDHYPCPRGPFAQEAWAWVPDLLGRKRLDSVQGAERPRRGFGDRQRCPLIHPLGPPRLRASSWCRQPH